MDEKKAQDIYLDNALEVNMLWQSLKELMYETSNPHFYSPTRDKDARAKFGEALARLGLIKSKRR